MDKPSKKDKSKLKVRPEDIIFGNHPEIDILKQIYSALKDKNYDSLGLLERSWIQGIEETYKSQIKLLMEQVYEILYQKEELWNPDDDELYSLLERVIFLKARESSFRDFFDNIESVIEAASRLDFSKRAPLSEISKDKRNILNYAVLCLNILLEKMETSVVSMKAVNAMLSVFPGIMVFVTDKNGIIRFVSDLGEKTLGVKKNGYLGKSIHLLLDDYEQITQEFESAGQVINRRVNLIIPGKKKKVIPVVLNIPKPYTEHSEMDEMVYSISVANNP